MPGYTRARKPGGTYFFTVVTYRRQPLLTEIESRHALRCAINTTRRNYPFDIDAWVLLPDHLHCIWTLPEGDAEFSIRWNIIKASFSRQMRDILHRDAWLSASREQRRETTIWQRRFWEHQIRDDQDFNSHMDYIHFNPVKHGLVGAAREWPFSSFHGYVGKGVYDKEWGGIFVSDWATTGLT